MVLPACSHGSHKRTGTSPLITALPAVGSAVKIGCIAPFSGARSYVGDRVKAALLAAVTHIQKDLGGTLGVFRPDVLTADAPRTASDGQQAYATLKAAGVDAVLWCDAPGLEQTVPQIIRDLMPVIAVGGADLQSRAATNPEVPDLATAASGFPVFQTGVPDAMAVDLMVGYLHGRGVTNVALIYAPDDFPNVDAVFTAACRSLGVPTTTVIALTPRPTAPPATTTTTVGISTSAFRTTTAAAAAPATTSPTIAATPTTAPGPARLPDGAAVPSPDDVSAALRQARSAGAEALIIFALPEEAAVVDAALATAGWRYVDTPSAKSSFRPMVLGCPPGVGDPQFAAYAAADFASGTLSAAALRDVVSLPTVPIRDWLARFVPAHPVAGGEVGPADALAAVLNAASEAGSTAGADIVAALESGVVTKFASAVPFAFTTDRHLAATAGDLVLTTLEAAAESRYALAHRGPAAQLLVDYTLAANTQDHPAVMNAVLAGRYGSSCRADYQPKPSQVTACKAVH